MNSYKEWTIAPEGEPEPDNLLLGGLPDQGEELVSPEEIAAICSELKGEI